MVEKMEMEMMMILIYMYNDSAHVYIFIRWSWFELRKAQCLKHANGSHEDWSSISAKG